ncbi:GvpL/GvpF family gas vesicle protein [Streptomyces sp. WMMC500]|uniref:GvpL/GvpF family gas vesicle protein n=1 Tax=Streptomyces sp. WMMC500 TaxID=3015154 RepID=UPI00248BBEA1|nr:GvpL/GvpF family gas vesicle protein [Streptomyces sp. WMMC500]WBB62907.1 GvpL/GvpF family gas vesicle protein [Streptomyces sp. WMMC500]
MTRLAYLYAVTRRGTPLPPELLGVVGEPVRLLEHGELAGVWSPVPAVDFDEEPLRAHLEDLRWLERTARAHQEVVDAVSSRGAVLPLRMAVVYRGEDGVRRLLTEDHDRLVAGLHRLAGLAEWGVKVYLEEPAPEAESAAGRERAPRPSGERPPRPSGRDYLRRRMRRREREEQDWERAAHACRLLHAQLSRVAQEDRLLRPQNGELARGGGRNVLNVSYLVAGEREREFVARARESDVPGVRVEVNGPWAPYSFAAPEAAP